jgi:hypothetical protein
MDDFPGNSYPGKKRATKQFFGKAVVGKHHARMALPSFHAYNRRGRRWAIDHLDCSPYKKLERLNPIGESP